MSVLNRQKLLEMANDLNISEVKIGDDVVFVKELTAAERDDYENSLLKQKGSDFSVDMANARAKLVAKTVCDKDGKRLFKDIDVDAVGQLPARVVAVLFEEAQKLNKITDEDVEDAVKN